MTKCVGKKKEARRPCPSAIHSGLPLWEHRAIRKTGGKNEAFIFQFFRRKKQKKATEVLPFLSGTVHRDEGTGSPWIMTTLFQRLPRMNTVAGS